MSTELVQPNIHIAIIHFPIALLAVGVFLETFSFLGWRKSSIRVAARWMILLGAIASAPVATSGIYALHDVRELWPIDDAAGEVVRDHVLFGAIASVAALMGCALWLGSSDLWRRRLHWPVLVLLLMTTLMTLTVAHHGGEMVYRLGIGVSAHAATDAAAPQHPATRPAGVAGLSERIAPVLPPLQIHMILGGLAAGLGIVSIGVASRAMIDRSMPMEPVERHGSGVIAAAFDQPLAQAVFAEERQTSAGQVIWLAVLAGATASLTGWWFAAHDGDIWNISDLWKNVIDRGLNDGRLLTRRTAHLIAGSSMIVLPLLLLAFSRFRPRARVGWIVVSLLLLLAIAAQVWLGQLMLLDESRVMGPVTRFSAP